MSQALTEISFLSIGVILLLGSGLGILGLISSLRKALTPIEAIPAALLVSSGVVGLWAVIGRITGMTLPTWSLSLLVISAVLLLLGLVMYWRHRRESRAETESRSYRTVLIALAVLAFGLMLRDGGSLGPVHDSLDFVSFLNESVQTGELAPNSPIYRADEGVPPDPRRGSFHTQISALCHLAGTAPTDGWRWLPRLLAPLAVLGICAMFRPWLGARAALLGTAFFIATTFFSFDRFIQNLGYASRFGWVCGWAGLMALGQGLVLRTHARWSESNALLMLAVASPAILLLVHLLSGFQVLLALGCAGLAVWTDRKSDTESRRAVWYVLIGATVLLIPVVFWRLAQPTDVVNPIFDHLYGVVLIGEKWPVLFPEYLNERLGTAGIIGMYLAIPLIFSIRRSRAAGFLAWSTVVSLFLLFFPPITRIVIANHAHSMLFRVILTIPYAGTLAWVTLWAARTLRDGRLLGRLIAAASLVLVLFGLAAQTFATRSEWAVPERKRAQFLENAPLIEALDFIDGRFAEVQTVLSDPISSYSIPAYTRHDAVAPFHQHSSPLDPTVGERICAVETVLNGRVGIERTVEALRRYDVDLILVNQSFDRYQTAYFVFISPLAYPQQSAKFAASPDIFEKIYEKDGLFVYAFNDPGPYAEFPPEPVNEDLIPDPGTDPLLAYGPIELLHFQPAPGPHKPGTPMLFELVWRRTNEPYRLPVNCDIKLQHVDRPKHYETPVVGRIIRRWIERREKTTLRFGHPFRPLVTFYPVFLWRPGETYKDERWENIPIFAKPGTYEVYARLGTEPYAKVVYLSEMISNHLKDDWRLMGQVEIRP